MNKYEGKKIYVVVAATIDSENDHGVTTISQPNGRQCAQVAHVVSKTRFIMLLKEVDAEKVNPVFEPITTIVLQCRDSAELNHVHNLLDIFKIPCYSFWDDNPVYGTSKALKTAIATEPVEPEKIKGILDYLPLLK